MKYLMFLILGIGVKLNAAQLGQVLYVQNNVNIIRAGNTEELRLKTGDIIKEGDRVAAGSDSRAKVAIFNNRNIINILPNSQLTFTKFTSRDKNTADVQLNLEEGRIRTKFKDKMNADSKFEIRTLNSVIGIRGTDFIVGYDSGSITTEVITFEGSVSFKGLTSPRKSFQTGSEVLVAGGQTSTNVKDGVPSSPTSIDPVQSKKLNEDSEVLTPEEQKALDKKSKKNKKGVGKQPGEGPARSN